ncbi:MAG: type I-B CRISPR-associated protein Cas7/Cst2/DevR, partial [Thermotoga sp.]|nr:type I-B CRISPR-associated protein Cas7/Cst2/DevR [Thermotoga sp.]
IDLKELKEKKNVATGNGNISLESVGEKAYKIFVTLDEGEKQKRLKEFFDIIINGFEIHSSTESWSVSPVFIVIATTKLPVTLFNPYVRLNGGKIDIESITKIAEENTNVIDYKIWGMPFILKGNVDKLCEGPKDLSNWINDVVGGKGNS